MKTDAVNHLKCSVFKKHNCYLVPERKLENFFKFKEEKKFNRRNTLSILRIKFFSDAEIEKISSFRSGTI